MITLLKFGGDVYAFWSVSDISTIELITSNEIVEHALWILPELITVQFFNLGVIFSLPVLHWSLYIVRPLLINKQFSAWIAETPVDVAEVKFEILDL